VGEDFEDAWHGECGAPIDAFDAALGDLTPDRDAVSEIGDIELGGIFRPARDLKMAIDTLRWPSTRDTGFPMIRVETMFTGAA
jgi:hypothetical protein